MELSLWHPIMKQTDLIWNAQVKMTQKRGGHLCAPLPKGKIGECGYLDEMTKEDLEERLDEYRRLLEEDEEEDEADRGGFPRGGLGVEVHCVDVGLEDPSVVANAHLKDEVPSVSGDATVSRMIQEWTRKVLAHSLVRSLVGKWIITWLFFSGP